MSFSALNWAWDVDTGSGTAKCVLAYLANCADGEGCCYPSMSTICNKTRHGEVAVRKALDDLEARGLISRENRWSPTGRCTSKLYRLAVAVIEAKPARDATIETPTPSKSRVSPPVPPTPPISQETPDLAAVTPAKSRENPPHYPQSTPLREVPLASAAPPPCDALPMVQPDLPAIPAAEDSFTAGKQLRTIWAPILEQRSGKNPKYVNGIINRALSLAGSDAGLVAQAIRHTCSQWRGDYCQYLLKMLGNIAAERAGSGQAGARRLGATDTLRARLGVRSVQAAESEDTTPMRIAG